MKKRKKKKLLRLAKTRPSISIRLHNATKSTEPNQRSRDERKVQLAFNFRLRRSPLAIIPGFIASSRVIRRDVEVPFKKKEKKKEKIGGRKKGGSLRFARQ